ncbi:MAG: FadD3 family acyl-CoA ligase [Sphingomonadaceae bacterium]
MLDPLPLTIPHLAKAAAARWGDAPALLENGETWSFNQLWAQCQKAASAFLARGIGNGDRIAIWAPNCGDWIVAAVGAMTAGATIVPLNTRLKGREAGDLLRRTRAKMLVTVDEFLGINYPALLADEDLPELENILLLRGFVSSCETRFFSHEDTNPQRISWDAFLTSSENVSQVRLEAALARLSPEDISDIMFTSGTTGIPKGVLSTHSRIIPQFRTWIENTGLSEGERYLIVNPFFHSFGMKAGWVACLMAGAVIVPMPVFDVKAIVATIERDRIAFLPGAPTIFQALLAEHERQPFDTSSLRGGTTGAAVVPPILIERIRSALGMADIITAYGMTECTNITGCRRGDPAELIATTCGVAVPGNELRIVDDGGSTLPAGEPGEILVRGIGVMKGYLDDPIATAEAIDAEGWLHTGDVGVLDEAGYLRITDRKKDMYISGGFNVYPAEVEKLLSAHPAVAQVAVIGVPDDRMGEVGKAFIILRPGATATPGDIIDWASDTMANYKAPRAVVFVEALPLNAAGKVMKTELR